jgi:membrane protein YdbS with pleckstrin-like domain
VRTWVSIALFFLISAFFLFALLAALHHSRKAVAVASACLAVAVCVIVFLTPVRLPTWLPLNQRDGYRIYQGGTTTTTESTPAPGPGDPDEPGTTLTTEGIGL